MSIAKSVAKRALHLLPDDGRLIKTHVRTLLVRKELLRWEVARYVHGFTLPDPRTVYWIDPARIEHHTRLKNESSDWEDWVFPPRSSIRTVQGGDWDESNLRVADMRICRAIADRINHGTPWPTTDFYKVAVKQIEDGRTLWQCSDREAFDRRCNDIDRLIDSLSKRGYQLSGALDEEIVVNISRDGLPLFQNGRHRLAIARALGLRKVAVQVLVRHSQWQIFRQYMHGMISRKGGTPGKAALYQNPLHFDLADIPYVHACEDRWEAMAAHLPSGSPGNALDIGCNLGFFCHCLEARGYDCTGVEYLPEVAYGARMIATAERRTFKVIVGDILAEETAAQFGTRQFTVMLALNIFHHFLKTHADFVRLRKFIGGLDIETLFFEAHRQDEPQMSGAYSNPSAEEFVGLLKEWGRFQSAERIYTGADGRALFILN